MSSDESLLSRSNVVLRNGATTLALCMAVACAQTQARTRATYLNGAWGGDRASLVTNEAGVLMTFPCASGRVDGAIALDRDGRFDAAGTLERRRGMKPSSNDVARDAVRAEAVHFSGSVRGDRLTLSIQSSDGSRGDDYVLTRGGVANVPLCGALAHRVTKASA